MKVSRPWLQRYFEKELPDAAALGEALTFHAFEIESIENDVLDVKVTANRGHDCLSHRGIAKELSAILELPMKSDSLREPVSLGPKSIDISLDIENPDLCSRYVAAYIKGVKVGPSPEWLRKYLESIGQKSKNNIVDAANFVMFDIGQPLHVFDADRIGKKISVRTLKSREGVDLLAKSIQVKGGASAKEFPTVVGAGHLCIADETQPIALAGIKGGEKTGVTEGTKNIVLESANFNGVRIRKTSQVFRTRTDASSRYEQVISPELCAYGALAVARLIIEIAGGELVGFVDTYPKKQQQGAVSVTAANINAILGSKLSDADIAATLTRLDLEFTKAGEMFVVEPPFERLDLSIPEDIAEEVGRIIGYDKIPAVELPPMKVSPEINMNFYAAEHAREEYAKKGYSEVFTSVFADKGERVVANKVDGIRPYLRTTLVDGLKDALEKNIRNKDLLGLRDVKLFEIGVVWKGGAEITMLGVADDTGVREEGLNHQGDALIYESLPLSQTDRFQPFSKYPFIVRDIALWVPEGTNEQDVLHMIRANAGELLVRSELFDTFKKDERTSLAFRLVFQSFDRTLTDFDANERMESVSKALKGKGWEVR